MDYRVHETFLCIGGPLAGKRHAESAGKKTFIAPIHPSLDWDKEALDTEKTKIEYKTYKLDCWTCGGERFWFWRLDNASPAEVINELMSNPKAFMGLLQGYSEEYIA